MIEPAPTQRPRRGDWCLTATGRAYWPCDPDPADVCIEDVCHALARINRFGGHTRVPYTVGQHSIGVALACPPELALVGLLHDAVECYVGDMVSPLRKFMPEFRALEKLNALAIGEHFGLGQALARLPVEVRRADLAMLAAEARDLMPAPPRPWVIEVPPVDYLIVPWPTHMVEELFMRLFRELTQEPLFFGRQDEQTVRLDAQTEKVSSEVNSPTDTSGCR